jgi:glutamate 5-kinase
VATAKEPSPVDEAEVLITFTQRPGAEEIAFIESIGGSIKRVKGELQRGDIVNIYDPDGVRLGCGITNYSSADIEAIKGAHSREIATLLGYDYGSEVVHRNNLVVL